MNGAVSMHHPDSSAGDQFDDISAFRASGDREVVSERVLTTIPVRKPKRDEFFRVRDDDAYTGDFWIVERDDEDRETYLVAEAYLDAVGQDPRPRRSQAQHAGRAAVERVHAAPLRHGMAGRMLCVLYPSRGHRPGPSRAPHDVADRGRDRPARVGAAARRPNRSPCQRDLRHRGRSGDPRCGTARQDRAPGRRPGAAGARGGAALLAALPALESLADRIAAAPPRTAQSA